MPKITLPDGSVKEFAMNSTPIDVAKSISEGEELKRLNKLFTL